jgi:aryl-alcohol dehydrogenase-like predicted oxidoreductase
MEGSSEGTLPRRVIPGTHLEASSIGLVLAGGAAGSPDRDAARDPLLRRARQMGVTTFVVGEGAGAPGWERRLARVLPAPDPEIVILVDRSPGSNDLRSSPDSAAPAQIEDALRRSIEESNERLGGHRVAMVRWDPSDGDVDLATEWGASLDRLTQSGLISGIVRAVRPPVALPPAPALRGPELYSGSLSLLDRRLEATLDARASEHELGFFAADAFASGRLDGRAIASSPLERGPGRPPTPVRELEREFEPVLRLRPLTEGRRRTLPELALAFVLRRRWVASAILDLPPAERLDVVLRAARAPPPTDEEWARIDGPGP